MGSSTVIDWPARFFDRAHVGRHWACNPAPSARCMQLMRNAASLVAWTAGPTVGSVDIQGLMLPAKLVAPAVWVNGYGRLNATVMRFASLRLLQQLVRTPGVTANELAQQVRLLDVCEIKLILGSFAAANLVETSGSLSSVHAASRYPEESTDTLYYAQLLRQVVDLKLHGQEESAQHGAHMTCDNVPK